MDTTNPKDCSALDLRPLWKVAYPSYGPYWDAAIQMGIDVAQLEYNISLTTTERLLQHEEMSRTFELIHSAALSKQR